MERSRVAALVAWCAVASSATVWAQSAEPAKTASPAANKDQAQAAEATRPLPSRPLGGEVFDSAAMRLLPAARTWWSLIETAEGSAIVDRIDNGGLYLGEPALIGTHGSSWTQASFVMDGLDITNPGHVGTPLLYLDPQVLSSVTTAAAVKPVEFGGGGPTVTLTPRAPAERWTGGFQASYLPHGLQGSTSDRVPPVAEFGSAGEGSLLGAGPLSGDATSLLFSARFADSRRFERGVAAPLDSQVASLFALASFRVSGNTKGRLVGSVDGATYPFAGRARFANRDVDQRRSAWHAHSTWEHTGDLAWSFTAGYQRAAYSEPVGAGEATRYVGTIDRLNDGPVPELFASYAGTDQRWDARLQVQPKVRRWFGASHETLAGTSITLARSAVRPIVPASVGELVDGLPARVWDYQDAGTGSQRSLNDLAAWFQDSISLFSRVRVDAGARFEATGGRSRDAAEGISWHGVLPRLSVQGLISHSPHISAYATYGSYRHRLPMEYLAYGDRSAPYGLIYRWFDQNGDARVQPSEYGPLVAGIGPGPRGDMSDSIDPDLKPPRTDEIVLGLEARFRGGWTGRLSAIERRTRWLVAPVDVGVTVADYTPIEIFDRGNNFLNPIDDRWLTVYNRNPASAGLDRAVLTNPPEHDGHYYGIELSVQRLFNGRWFTMISGSAHRTDGLAANRGFRANENDVGVLGELFQDPNALTYARGRVFTDRGYVLKWSTAYVGGRGWQAGAIARYQDGQHFSRMLVADFLNQGPELIQTYTRGHSRFTFTFTLDARFEKAWTLAGQRVSAVVEVFNLLNTANEVEEDPVTTRSFRASTALQPPRAIRFGFRLDLR